MPHTWTQALNAYSYRFDLRRFADAEQYPGWFLCHSDDGSRDDTMKFEDHFREHARQNIEPWLEVVYWKMYILPMARDILTRHVAERLIESHITANHLWVACTRYLNDPTGQNFDDFRVFLIAGQQIALAATFPAFMCPDRYPMIDNVHVAQWIGHCMEGHNAVDPAGPQLVPHVHHGGLNMGDFEFMQAWMKWCRHIAGKLTRRTKVCWRARDVEMAVFRAWGGRHDPHPALPLNPLAL